MRFTWLILSVLFVSALAHDGHDHDHDHDDGPDHVLDLNDSTFDETIKKHDIILVEFFAPWCGHCKRLTPEYKAAAAELLGKIALAKVDCTQQKVVCDKYGVQGFPTLKVFRGEGTPAEYNGGRTAKEIVSYMKKQAAPAFVVAKTADEVAAFLGNNKGDDDLAVVAFVSSLESAEAETIKSVAKALREDVAFAFSDDAAAAAAQGAKVGDVVIFRNFDEPKITYTGELTIAALTEWAKAKSVPLVGAIGPENYQKYVQRELPLVWLFVDYAEKAVTDNVLAAARAVAGAFAGKVIFVHLDGKRWVDHAKHFGLSGNTPGVVIENRESRKNYLLPEADGVSEATLNKLVQGFVDGTVAPNLKSEEIPADNSGPVKTIVGKTFEQIVFDSSKDVFVEFYAPWCGHCKKLVPEFEKLGEEFAGVDSIVIAKIDSTANDAPADVKGFPTLIFYPANNKKTPLTYNGDRTAEAMAKYIRENVSVPITKSEAAAAAKHDEL